MTATVKSVVRSTHVTLSAATVDKITLTGGHNAAEIKNHSASTTPIYFRFDGTDVVSAADDTYYVEPGEAVVVGIGEGYQAAGDPVTLISSGTAAYSVTAVTQ